jgi:hypothetical protein
VGSSRNLNKSRKKKKTHLKRGSIMIKGIDHSICEESKYDGKEDDEKDIQLDILDFV